MPDSDAIDRLIQQYDARFSDADHARHAQFASDLLGGRANQASRARPALEAAIGGADDALPAALGLFAACGQVADMARAALEYQIRINEVILGYPVQ